MKIYEESMERAFYKNLSKGTSQWRYYIEGLNQKEF